MFRRLPESAPDVAGPFPIPLVLRRDDIAQAKEFSPGIADFTDPHADRQKGKSSDKNCCDSERRLTVIKSDPRTGVVMSRPIKNTEVLVVGAGPVGMFAALLLAKNGIAVTIIDGESRPATHSYACGLHPRTFKLLRQAGLADEALKRGRQIDTLAFYQEGLRRGEIKLAKLPLEHPFVLVLPQSDLEAMLERALREAGGVQVLWNHHLVSLHPTGDTVLANIDELGETVTGYIVPHWETVVMNSFQMAANFVIGADGHNSFVRRVLGIDYQLIARPELFVVYEFDSAASAVDEVRIVLDQTTTNVFWPLPQGRCRWGFQWPQADDGSEFPTKDRTASWCEGPAGVQRSKEHLRELIRSRAPWFTGGVENLDWAIDVQFERRLAARFGQGRCWLTGDAAHQTGPVGAQSMNMGFREAESLTSHLKTILREGASLDLLESYDRAFQDEWRCLLARDGKLKPVYGASPLRLQNPDRLLSCIPASGEELGFMLRELGFDLK